MEQLLRITMIIGACFWVAGLLLMLFAENAPGGLLMAVGFPFLIIALSFLFIEWREERALKHEVRMTGLTREAKLAKGDLV